MSTPKSELRDEMAPSAGIVGTTRAQLVPTHIPDQPADNGNIVLVG
ncbi:MAG TPA: hypothetical protein VLA19_18620 [Herpetosiphonaceae bacterium]|nr:hypothetical protein [Herpetosiphonaceae bacterium]